MNETKLPPELETLRAKISKDVAEVITPFLPVLEKHENRIKGAERKIKMHDRWLLILTAVAATTLLIIVLFI